MQSPNLFDLGDDILVTEVTKHLSPEDIFNFSILNKATYNLFYNSQVSSSLYKILYNKKFTNNDNNFSLSTRDELNWSQLFKLRIKRSQKIYTWGSSQFGRLGYLVDLIDSSHVTSNNFGMRNVHTPSNIKNFNDHLIVDIIANGFCFLILTNGGDIFYTGLNWIRPGLHGNSAPGPSEGHDYKPLPSELALNTLQGSFAPRFGGRRLIPSTGDPSPGGRLGVLPLPTSTHGNRYDRDVDAQTPQSRRSITNPNLTRPPEELPSLSGLTPPNPIKESNFLTKFRLPLLEDSEGLPESQGRKIISISSGREHILALDNLNNIYTWDTGNASECGVRLTFPGLDRELPISKIYAGWNLSGCYVDNIGLIIWYSRASITKQQYESEDIVADVKYVIVPQTRANIVDFSIGNGYALFIRKSDKKLYKFDLDPGAYISRGEPIPSDELFLAVTPLDNFNRWLEQYNFKNILTASFSRLSTCYTNFAVFTNDDSILVGNRTHLSYVYDEDADPDDEGAQPKVIPELQKQSIKTIEIGDYHYLALTHDGNILSWGTESNNCGCLGVGPKHDFIRDNDASVVRDIGDGKGMEVLKPTKVRNPPFPGKWVTIAASGWHSGGIYIPTDD